MYSHFPMSGTKSRMEGAMRFMLKRITVVCGHYGSGKTNVAVNLALHGKKENPDSEISIADVDIVNPYFRTADAAELLRASGVHPLIPEFANSNVDIPSLPNRLTSLFTDRTDETEDSKRESLIIDVGGDEGAVALGMYNDEMRKTDYDMLYVVNQYRPLTENPEEAAALMREIESASRLHCTGIVNNSSLGSETTTGDIVDSEAYAHRCAECCGLPLLFHSYYSDLVPGLPEAFQAAGYGEEILFPMRNVTRKLF